MLELLQREPFAKAIAIMQVAVSTRSARERRAVSLRSVCAVVLSVKQVVH